MDSIIFDVDGTLWDSTDVVAKSWNKTAKEYYNLEVHFTASGLKAQFGKLLPDIARAVFPDLSGEDQMTLIEACCQAEHEALLADSPGVFPGMDAVIKTLYKTYPLYIVSNCQAGYIEVFLEATALGSYFQDHLCPGDTGNPKADNIREIIQRNGLKEAVYVGDTLGDYEAAKAAGVPFIFASYGFGTVETPDGIISAPGDLLNLTAKII